MSVQEVPFPKAGSSAFSSPVIAEPKKPIRLTVEVPALPKLRGRLGLCFYADNKDDPKAPVGRVMHIRGSVTGSAPFKNTCVLRDPPKFIRLYVEVDGIDTEAFEDYAIQFSVEEIG